MDLASPLTSLLGNLGGAAGAALGQAGEFLGAPRRLLMQALGLPETGAELLQKHLGMDDGFGTHALGMGVEMLTDPLTLLGSGLGRLGAKAAAPGLERAALARGPNYAGGIEKLTASVPKKESADVLLEALQGHPNLPGILKEVPPGSQYLGHGVEAMAYKTPAGDVLRIEPGAQSALARPASPDVVQAHRAGMVGDARIERSPLVDTAAHRGDYAGLGELEDRLAKQSIGWADPHMGNVGTLDGRRVVLDPGGLEPIHGSFPELGQLQQQPGGFTNWLLDRLGADRQVQGHLDRLAANPPRLPGSGPVAGPAAPRQGGVVRRLAPRTPEVSPAGVEGDAATNLAELLRGQNPA